jgi:hypothetical protein
MTPRPVSHDDRTLLGLLLLYGTLSLVHFIHNAEFLASYPGMPPTWTRAGVYGAWLAISCVGIVGWLTLRRANRLLGLALLAIYAVLGMDSLGHYVLAPLSAHDTWMNATILLDVTSAALVLAEVARRLIATLRRAPTLR